MRLTWTDANGLFKDEVITIDLAPESAPVHVENLHLHATNGNYDDTIFHRVIGDNENTPEYDPFMIQGGDFENNDGTGGYAAQWYGYCDGQYMSNSADCNSETLYTLPDEADNGLEHNPCVISMAKTSQPHTGGSQFFLLPEDAQNPQTGEQGTHWLDGIHTVFGKIISGCEHVTSLSEVETGAYDRPIVPVIISSATVSE